MSNYARIICRFRLLYKARGIPLIFHNRSYCKMFDASIVKKATDVEKINEVFVSGFKGNALVRLFTRRKKNIPVQEPLTEAHFDFTTRVRQHIKAGALIFESYDYNSVIVWYPPGLEVAPHEEEFSELPDEVKQFITAVTKFKESYFGSEGKYWHLNTITRNHNQRSIKGGISKLVNPVLDKCRESNIVAYLEAIDEHAREVYEHFGFKVVETHIIGEGTLDHKGDLKEGGEGIKVYNMIFDPKSDF